MLELTNTEQLNWFRDRIAAYCVALHHLIEWYSMFSSNRFTKPQQNARQYKMSQNHLTCVTFVSQNLRTNKRTWSRNYWNFDHCSNLHLSALVIGLKWVVMMFLYLQYNLPAFMRQFSVYKSLKYECTLEIARVWKIDRLTFLVYGSRHWRFLQQKLMTQHFSCGYVYANEFQEMSSLAGLARGTDFRTLEYWQTQCVSKWIGIFTAIVGYDRENAP